MFDYWARLFGNIWYKSLEISWDIKFHSLNQIWTKLLIYLERDFLTVTIVYILCSIILHHFRKNHKRVNHEIVGCITLVQSEPELQFIPKGILLEMLTNIDFVRLMQPIMLYHFEKTLRDQIMRIRLHDFRPSWLLSQKICLENWLILLMCSYSLSRKKYI